MEKDRKFPGQEFLKKTVEGGGWVTAGVGLYAIAFANSALFFTSLLAGAGLYVAHRNLNGK